VLLRLSRSTFLVCAEAKGSVFLEGINVTSLVVLCVICN